MTQPLIFSDSGHARYHKADPPTLAVFAPARNFPPCVSRCLICFFSALQDLGKPQLPWRSLKSSLGKGARFVLSSASLRIRGGQPAPLIGDKLSHHWTVSFTEVYPFNSHPSLERFRREDAKNRLLELNASDERGNEVVHKAFARLCIPATHIAFIDEPAALRTHFTLSCALHRHQSRPRKNQEVHPNEHSQGQDQSRNRKVRCLGF